MFPKFKKFLAILFVLTILSIIFGLTVSWIQYRNRTNIENQLIHNVERIYEGVQHEKRKNGKILVTSLEDNRKIEATYGVLIKGKDMTCHYLSTDSEHFEISCEYFRTGFYFTGENFTIRADQRPLSKEGDINPCCITDGLCPTLADCS
jgi:hypothetical protein